MICILCTNILRLPLSYHEILIFPLLWLLYEYIYSYKIFFINGLGNQAHIIKFKESKEIH